MHSMQKCKRATHARHHPWMSFGGPETAKRTLRFASPTPNEFFCQTREVTLACPSKTWPPARRDTNIAKEANVEKGGAWGMYSICKYRDTHKTHKTHTNTNTHTHRHTQARSLSIVTPPCHHFVQKVYPLDLITIAACSHVSGRLSKNL